MRTGRILVNAPTAVGALGGVYNSLTPTFSLGCGTWGGSMTTDNVNYRNLLNLKTVSRRSTPPQWFRVPSDTYFNVGALDSLRDDRDHDGRHRQRRVQRRARRRRRGPPHLNASDVRVFADVTARARRGDHPRRRRAAQRTCAPTSSWRSAAAPSWTRPRRCGCSTEHPELSIRELSLPFLDARKRVARYPTPQHSIQLVAIPTTAGTGSEVSPAAVITSQGRKVTLVDYSLVPDVAVIDPTLSASMPPAITADTGIDALTHALEAAVSIFASPYTDAFCVQAAPAHLRVAAEGVRATATTSRRAPRWPTRQPLPGLRSRTPSSG